MKTTISFLKTGLLSTIAGGCFIVSGGFMSCSDDALNPDSGLTATSEVMVEVEIPIELEDGTDGFELLSRSSVPDMRNGGKNGLDVMLVADAQTRTEGITDPLKTAKPDKIYELHVLQLNQTGGVLTNTTTNYVANQAVEPGEKVTLKLAVNADCQLILYARGGTSSEASAAGGGMSNTNWTTLKVPAARINAITTVDGMKNMPYQLHLKHVKVIAGSTTGMGIIQSVTGMDARLRMKRLAARLNVSWNYNVPGYTLQEITLQDIPLNYIVIPSQTEVTYPSLVDQFTTKAIYVRGVDTESAPTSYSCWMPRNVRGKVNITSQERRGKSNAPTGGSYLRFVAVSNINPKKKLIYRIYLGGNVTNDFNILDNTNYNYNLSFSHTNEDIWMNDDRVEYLNGIKASENNNTPVPTANCFMVEPGGSFNFDPFTFRQMGQDIENTTLTEWTKGSRGGIKSVKLLWQTRENGDVGDPVVGIVNSETDHSNMVDIVRVDGSSIESNPAKLPGDCRIYCRVAANTTGGNGLIAAYDASGAILWSWHLWVTVYDPSPSGDATVLEPVTKRKQKYAYRTDIDQLPMMDRNLGAREGYVSVPATELERSKANGLHYQWGRKDPFPGSYSSVVISSVSVSNSSVPTDGLLNLYGPDGYTFLPRSSGGSKASIENSCKNPMYVYGRPWYATEAQYWGDVSTKANKTLYDPCPQGWRVAEGKNFYHLFSNTGYSVGSATNSNSPMRLKDSGLVNNGGALAYYDTSTSTNATYFRMTGYQEYTYAFNYVGRMLNIWCRDHTSSGVSTSFNVNQGGLGGHYVTNVSAAWNSTDAHNVRCIQEEK